MSSKRYTILEYLKDTLFPTIIAGATYNFTLGLTERGMKAFDQLSDADYPCLFVASADEARDNVTRTHFNSRMTVYLYGGVKQSATNLNIQVELDKFIEDVTKCLWTDRTQGSRVADTEIKEIWTDKGDDLTHAFFIMTVEFLYKSLGTTP